MARGVVGDEAGFAAMSDEAPSWQTHQKLTIEPELVGRK